VQTLPGADIDSDHNLQVAKICIRLKKIIRFHKPKPRRDLETLYALVGKVDRRARKPWITQEMISKMDE
jgi:hypothetical protein